jgi:HPt (histidine-containing phosphotransfer) domain-containing protein
MHTLKGTAANLSATELQKVSLEFEMDLREIAEKDSDEKGTEKAALVVDRCSVLVKKQLDQLETSLAQLNELLVKSKESVRVSPLMKVDREQLFETLARLKGMSEAFDPMAEEFWIEHKYGFLDQNIDEEITRMENHLRNYNFERAVDFIGRIERALKKEEV